MRTFFVMILLCTAMAATALAQPPDNSWSRYYGGSADDRFAAVCETADGGLLLGGWNSSLAPGNTDFWLVRTNALGQQVWSRTYGGVNQDYINCMVLLPDGGCILAGASMNAEWQVSALAIRVDAAGTAVWSREIGGGDGAVFNNVVATGDSGVVLTGYNSGGAWLLRLQANGNTQWSRNYPGIVGTDVLAVPGGGYAMAIQIFDRNYDYRLTRTDANGVLLWQRTYGTIEEDRCRSIALTRDGGFMLGGYSHGCSEWEPDLWLVKVGANGDSLWSRAYDYPVAHSYDYGIDMQRTFEGGFIIAGWTNTSATWISNVWVVRVTAMGDTLWTKTFGGAGSDNCLAVQQLRDGGYALVGNSNSGGAGDNDGYLIRTTPDHTLAVELASFAAEPVADGIRLAFQTASETDNDRFEIWRGSAADGDFASIAVLPSQGNSAGGYRYEVTDTDVLGGQRYWYYLVSVDQGGSREEHRGLMRDAVAPASVIPRDFSLAAFPNPFNASTRLTFALPEAAAARLVVFDIAGREVATLLDAPLTAGIHELHWNAADLGSGIYFLQLSTPHHTRTQKLVLMK